jgi:hypothetical protein
VCASASAPEKVKTCGSSKLVSANVTVQGRRQLLVQLEGRLSCKLTPFTENAVTLLSKVNVQLTQCCCAACSVSQIDRVVVGPGKDVVVDVASVVPGHGDVTALRKYAYRSHPAPQILVYEASTVLHALHVNAESVGTAGNPSSWPRYHAVTDSDGAGSVLEKVDHVRSDCTPFHRDSGDVLSHTRANPAALVLPQYDPV